MKIVSGAVVKISLKICFGLAFCFSPGKSKGIILCWNNKFTVHELLCQCHITAARGVLQSERSPFVCSFCCWINWTYVQLWLCHTAFASLGLPVSTYSKIPNKQFQNLNIIWLESAGHKQKKCLPPWSI